MPNNAILLLPDGTPRPPYEEWVYQPAYPQGFGYVTQVRDNIHLVWAAESIGKAIVRDHLRSYLLSIHHCSACDGYGEHSFFEEHEHYLQMLLDNEEILRA